MVLTKNQAEQFNNGKLTKSTFLKVMYTVDFENYLYRYCKIVDDFKNEYLGNFYRITSFSIFNYHVIVHMKNGECEKIEYTKIN
jgi:hypothetical protein